MSFEWLTMNLENNFIPKGNIFNIDIFIYSGSGSEHPTTESFDRILEVSQALEYQLPDSIHPESKHHLPLEPENLPPSENNLSPSLDQQETDLPLPPPPEDLPAIPADIFLLDNGSDENWPLPPMPEDFPPITDASLPSPDLPPPPLDTSTFTGRSLEPIFHSLSPPSVYQTEDPMIPDEPNIGSIMLNVLSNLEANSEEVVPPFRIFGSAFDEEIAAEIVAGQDRVTGQDERVVREEAERNHAEEERVSEKRVVQEEVEKNYAEEERIDGEEETVAGQEERVVEEGERYIGEENPSDKVSDEEERVVGEEQSSASNTSPVLEPEKEKQSAENKNDENETNVVGEEAEENKENNNDKTDDSSFIAQIKAKTIKLSSEETTQNETEELLRELIAITPFEKISAEVLLETSIAKVVRKLRDTEGNIGRLAGRLVNRWKKNIYAYKGPMVESPKIVAPKNVELTPPPPTPESSHVSPIELESATVEALARLRKANADFKKRKANEDASDNISKRICFDVSSISQATPDIPNHQITLGENNSFFRNNSTPIAKDLSNDLEAVEENPPKKQTKCKSCGKTFKRLGSHSRFCKGLLK